VRGSSVKLRRSLRTRVVAASALAFLGLTAMVCLVLPRAYEHEVQESFNERTRFAARGLSFLLARPDLRVDAASLESLSGWLAADPAFEGAAVLDKSGHVLAKWPESAGTFGEPTAGLAKMVVGPTDAVAFHPCVENGADSRVVAVRMSTRSIVRDMENVRWLFASIFLFTCGVFFVLTSYLTRTILQPLEEIGRAAMSLADGEPVVQVPRTGDREIDELGEFISRLGESRRQSRVMMSPMELRHLHERTGTKPISDDTATDLPASHPTAPHPAVLDVTGPDTAPTPPPDETETAG
jgi:HAMP domain-containing protein